MTGHHAIDQLHPIIIDHHETLMIALGQQCYCPLKFVLSVIRSAQFFGL